MIYFSQRRLIDSINKYVESVHVDGYEYLFAKSCSQPTIYASVYACMIRGWKGNVLDKDKREWAEYLNSYQREDGLYIDERCYNERYMDGDGWGARHLIPHLIIALKRLDAKPKYEFEFLKKYCNPDEMIKLLNGLDYANIWGSSNVIMNYGVMLQYARDYMDMNCYKSIEALEDWLLKAIREDCAMWQSKKEISGATLYETIRGAYHIYPLLIYDGINIPNFERVIPYIIASQNKQGGFDSGKYSSACADIDAIDPLLRAIKGSPNCCESDIHRVINKSRRWILKNRNFDGGFVYDRRGPFSYGGAEQLSSKLNESNLFGTWFRALSLLYIEDYEKKNGDFLLKFPGYELRME